MQPSPLRAPSRATKNRVLAAVNLLLAVVLVGTLIADPNAVGVGQRLWLIVVIVAAALSL